MRFHPGIIAGTEVEESLPTFTYEAETETLVAAFSVAPTTRRKKSINKAIKRLKDAGVWTKTLAFWRVGNDEQSSLINWKTPGTKNLIKVGTPTFVANNYYAPAASARLRTQVNLDELDPANCGMFLYTKNNTATSSSDVGALTASGIGITINPLSNTGSQTMTARCGSNVNTTIATTADYDGTGFHLVTRTGSATFEAYRGPVKKADVATVSGTMGPIEIDLLGINNNGTHSIGTRRQSCWGIFSAGLTATESKVLANVVRQLDNEFQYGEYDTYDAGYAPSANTFDVVVYGATSQGAVAAYEAARQGLSVALVGGWRDRHIGGMSSAGLGYTDFENKDMLGGLPRWILTQIQALQSTSSTTFTFAPINFERVIRQMFDPRITGIGQDIPVYWSNGVTSASKSGARITSLTTADGRTFTGRYFIDASYEGDLMAKAGVSTRLGRESSASLSEDGAGYRNVLTTLAGDNHQFKDHSGSLINIDPYVTPGDSNSGLLPSVQGTIGVDTPAQGAADSRIQSYNFRITATTNKAYHVPFASTPPPNYDPAKYEALLRWLAADPTLVFQDVLKVDTAYSDVLDINAKWGFSTDLWGGSWTYPEASYADREVIWKAHENHIRGLFYLLQYENDARIPSGVRASALQRGLDARHYTSPHENDDFQWMPQLYVREAFRMDNDFMLFDDDMAGTDGTALRSDKTIAVASYPLDSHSVWALADPNGGTPRIWNEGNFERSMGGTDETAPIPYEVITPRKSEAENLLVVFAVAATHVAFGSYRMEFTSMQAAQSASVAVKVAADNADQAVQDVDYATLRAALLATNTLTGETDPVLPQVH